jgi:cysteine desulfurase
MPLSRVFLDASGSAPLTPRVHDALRAGYADGWADPRRLSYESRRAQSILDGAREAVADAVGNSPELTFLIPDAVLGLERAVTGMFSARRGRDRILVSSIEREVMLRSAEFVAAGVDTIPVDDHGHVDLEALAAFAALPDAALAAIQHANQEIGTIQRLEAVAEILREHQVPLLVDATASIGHVEAPRHWDALVAHPADWGGPSGVGVLALRDRTRWLPAWPDNDPWAPGTVSIPLALAAAVALQERLDQAESTRARLFALVDRLRGLLAHLEGVAVVGDPVERLPHVLTAAFLYLDGEPLVSGLDREGFAVGSGSACGKADFRPSHVLAAMGALSHGNLRLSLHPGISEADVDRFVDALRRVIETTRQQMGASQ